jgi:hypothetical protein
VAGASVAFLATTRVLVGQWRALGMEAAGSLERMTLQFRPLLGSMASARERVKDLANFAIKTPFELPEIVEANKMLEVLTQGALSTEKGMTLVGDAASVAGTAFSDTARMVGRLYDGLMSGRPVGEAAMRLQEMGIISGTVRNQLESMQAAGASGLDIWKIMETQLRRNNGAMDEQSRSLEGLQSTWADTKRQMEGGFSAGFLDGEKAGVESSIAVMEAMSPVMANLGRELGAAENAWAKFKLGMVKSVTSAAGFGTTVEWLTKGLLGLGVTMATASIASIALWGAKILRIAAGARAAADGVGFLTDKLGAQIPAATKLTSVKNALLGALNASHAGLKGEASGHLGAAAAGMKNLAVTNGLSTAVQVGNKVWLGMGAALKFVGVQLRMMAVAVLANPMVWLAAAVAILVAGLSKLAANTAAAKEKLEGYVKATAALDSGMRKQIADIRTLVDLRAAESRILTELASAYKAVDAAREPADKAAAQRRVDVLKGQLGSLPNTRRLEKGESELALDAGQREGAIAVREFDRDAMAAKGPEEALRVAEDRLQEVVDRRREAFELAQEEADADERGAAARQAGVATEGQRLALFEKRAKLENEVDRLEAIQESIKTPLDARGGAGVALMDLPKRKEELEAIQGKIREMANMPEAKRLEELLASPSELQQIKAKLEAIDQLKAAVTGLDVAQNAAAQNADSGKAGELGDAVAAAREQNAQAEKLAGQAGVTGDSRDRQTLVTRQTELEARRAKDEDPLATRQAEKDAADAARATAAARLDAEGAVASLRLKGVEREERLLDIERQKLRLKMDGAAIGVEEFNRQSAILDAQAEATKRDGAERREDLANALETGKLRRGEEAAKLAGDPGLADTLRRAAEARDDVRNRRDAVRDAEGAGGTAGERAAYVADRVREERAARDEERRRSEEERARGRARSVADQNSGVAAIESERLRLNGKSEEAKRVAEAAARKQDELDRAEAGKKFRGQGFTGPQADRMADTEIKTHQVDRFLSAISNGMGTVVASSLARVGGGGNVTGTDPAVRELEIVQNLLRQILDESKKTVNLEIEN